MRSEIRRAAYQTLSLWCATIKHGSLVESIADDLIKAIIFDVTPFHAEVTLKVLAGSRKYLSKKARQKLHKAQNEASNIVQTHSKAFNPHNTKIVYSDNGNEQLCAVALNGLVAVLQAAGCFLKPTYQKILQENIVGLALATVNTVPKQSNLYFNAEARLALYNALFALVQCPHHLCPPPLQYALEVFRIVQTSDVNATIRQTCGNHLRALEKTLHPQKETIFFPTDVNEVNEAFERHAAAAKQNISDDSDSESEVCAIKYFSIQGNYSERKMLIFQDEDIVMSETPSTPSVIALQVSDIVPIVEIDLYGDQIDLNGGQAENDSDQAEDAVDSAAEAQSELLAAEPIEKSHEPITTTNDEIVDNVKSSPVKELPESIPTIEIDPSPDTVADNDDKSLKSPPRKSARLSAKRRLSESLDSPIVRSESPLPRRRSTRRNSNSSQVSEIAKSDALNVTLSTIAETQQQIDDATGEESVPTEETAIAEDAVNTSKSDKADQSIDELASAFIEEFVEEFVDIES